MSKLYGKRSHSEIASLLFDEAKANSPKIEPKASSPTKKTFYIPSSQLSPTKIKVTSMKRLNISSKETRSSPKHTSSSLNQSKDVEERTSSDVLSTNPRSVARSKFVSGSKFLANGSNKRRLKAATFYNQNESENNQISMDNFVASVSKEKSLNLKRIHCDFQISSDESDHEPSILSPVKTPRKSPLKSEIPLLDKNEFASSLLSDIPSLKKTSSAPSIFSNGHLKTTTEKSSKPPLIRKILSSPSKKQSKCSYNARSWTSELPTENGSNVNHVNSHIEDALNTTIKQTKPKFDELKYVRRMTVKANETLDQSAQFETKIRVNRSEKELYLVVRNVKGVNECLEVGENQQFLENVRYLMEGMFPSSSLSIRCLSVMGLAQKCATSAFRLQMRNHGMLAKVSEALRDSHKYPSLGLCAASLYYAMSRDRLGIDIDLPSFCNMTNLLKCLPSTDLEDESVRKQDDKEIVKARRKVSQLISNFSDNTSTLLKCSSIEIHTLILEAFLSIETRNVTDRFKKQVVAESTVDYFIVAFEKCVGLVCCSDFTTADDELLLVFKKLIRLSNFLICLTYRQVDNLKYIIIHNRCAIVSCTDRLFQRLLRSLPKFPDSGELDETDSKDIKDIATSIRELLLEIIRLALNLSHESELGSTKLGNEENLIHQLIDAVMIFPQYFHPNKRFDLIVLALGLLINLVEYSPSNRKLFTKIQSKFSFDSKQAKKKPVSAIHAFVELFYAKEKMAREIEKEEKLNESNDDNTERNENDPTISQSQSQNDPSGQFEYDEDGNMIWVAAEEDPSTKTAVSSQDENKKLLTAALDKAGKHMEYSMVAAYIALFLGCLIQNNPANLKIIKQYVSDFSVLSSMLRKLHNFMNLTTVAGTSVVDSILKVIEVLDRC